MKELAQAGVHLTGSGSGSRWFAKRRRNAPPSPADATGKDRRTRGVAKVATPAERFTAARGKALGPDLAEIAGTSLDNGMELDALAKMERVLIFKDGE
ncbi:MAG: hypothetical protein ACR652_10175 [Methylocystis sp.]|uniref:hypothetical protein n=1 Tax=Methylocystis sp. TaxID=1911079 RepID=UPI003DA2A513